MHRPAPLGLSHVTVSASDFAASLAFYDAVFAALGVERAADYGDEEEDDAEVEVASWGAGPSFWLTSGATATCGAHLALLAVDAGAVDRFHADALAAGGSEHTRPRRWAIYRRGRYGAIVRDPDGNLVEVIAPE